jgi:cation diffusion facilitator family transporter
MMQAARSSVATPAVGADHERRTWVVAAVNGVAMAVLVVGGLALNSAAVLAEGLHMSAHLGALAIGAAAYRVAGRLRGRGARGVIDLAGLANAALLMLVATFLVLESLGDLRQPHPIDLPIAIGLAGLGLMVNLVSLRLLHRPGRLDPARGQDLNFRAIYLHMAGDAAVGLISIAALLLTRFLGWSVADGVAGLLGATLLAVLAVQIVKTVWTSRGVAARKLHSFELSGAAVKR